MSSETLRAIAALPAIPLLFLAVWWLYRFQAAVTTRFEHLILALKEDIRDLERRNDELEGKLAIANDARRADNARCDEQIAILRSRLAQLTPPGGNPIVGD